MGERQSVIITEKNGNMFDSQGNSTRAEVSTVLHRFMELVTESNQSQGWMMTSFGKWTYYETEN